MEPENEEIRKILATQDLGGKEDDGNPAEKGPSTDEGNPDTRNAIKGRKFNGDDGYAEKKVMEIEEIKEVQSESIEKGAETGDSGRNGLMYTKDAVSDEGHVVHPNSLLPQPEAPQSLTKSASGLDDYSRIARSVSAEEKPSFGKFLRDSASLIKRMSSVKGSDHGEHVSRPQGLSDVTEFHLSGLKVTVQLKDSHLDFDFNGRISFFSRSGCRDCTAVRSFFREKGLGFVEINLDVFPERENDLIRRAGSTAVPRIFFNEELIGGLLELNGMRNGEGLEMKLKEVMGRKSLEGAPAEPVYGFDDPDEAEETDLMIGIVRLLRSRLPIQDRFTKMKIARSCFTGSDLVEVITNHLDCERKKAVEIGKELARRHFIHHVFQENDFEDGNHLYRFLEQEPAITRCFNFRGVTNDSEPKSAAVVGQKLRKIMLAILEAYASDDRKHVDYIRIGNSEEFRRYMNLAQDLQRIDILALPYDERLTFFLNLYNAMVIHAVIRIGCPGLIDRRTFYGDFSYIVGGYPYSLAAIKNGILRSNQRQPYSLIKPFSSGDKRLEVALPKVNPLVHFGLCNGTRSSPIVRFFSAEGVEAELRAAARDFFLQGAIEVDLHKRSVYVTRIMKWYSADFGSEKDALKWILNYLDANKAGLLTHLLSDFGGPINVIYQNYDWSLNS